MSRLDDAARWALLQQLATTAAKPDQPQTLYRAADAALSQVAGHKLFTLMILHPHSGEAERVYSNQPDAYPVAGRKQTQQTPWFQQAIVAKKHYLGSTDDDIRWAFADHQLIKQLSCGSVINVLAIYDDQVLGSANLLHEQHHYSQQDIIDCVPFVQLLTAPFQQARLRVAAS